MVMTDARERVLAQIDQDELVDLARGLARFQSFSGQERECAEWLGEYMARNGLEVELRDAEPGRPNVLARQRGDGSGARLMFNGHLDVEPVPRNYKHDPWSQEIRDGKLYGHGLTNMKAGVASMVHVAIAVKRSGIPLQGDLVVAAVVGELQAGVGTAHLVTSGEIPDLALLPEPSNMNVRSKHAGIFCVLIRVQGIAGWIGGAHLYKTVNAVDKMADVIRALRDLQFTYTPNPELPGLPRYVVGTVVGGLGDELVLWKPSMVPDTCAITLEVRLLPGMTVDQAIADIERALAPARAADPDLQVEVLPPPAAYREPWRANPVVQPPLNLPVDHPLVQLVVRQHRQVRGSDPERVGVEDPGSHAGTDAGHLFQAGAKCLIYGPTMNLFGESYVELDKLLDHARVFAGCAAEILTTERERWVQ
jgi:acetylornithine deacetylase/succinyl-diaminopimelate desuccinylase-like protein